MFDIAILTVDRSPAYIHTTLASLFASCRTCSVPSVRLVVSTPSYGYLDSYRDHAGVQLVRPSEADWAATRESGPHYRLTHTTHRALGLPLSTGSAGLCLCEDDVVFRDDFIPKLQRTINEMSGEFGLRRYLLAVYCPENYENEPGMHRGKHFCSHHGCQHYGNQCMFIPSAVLGDLREFIRERGVERNERPNDLLFGQYTCDGHAEMYACSPSLVRHVGA